MMKKALPILVAIGVLCALPAATTDRFTGRFQRAEELMSQGYYEQAIREFQGLAKDAAQQGYAGEVRFRVGECYFNLGRFSEAIAEFDNVLGETDSRYAYLKPEAQYALGMTQMMLGNLGMAENYFRQVQDLPERTQFGQGMLLYRKAPLEKDRSLAYQDYANALAKFEEMKSPLALLYAARCDIALRKPLEAMAILNRVVRTMPNTIFAEYAKFNMGEANFAYGDFGGALLKYSEFLSQYPQSALANYAAYKKGACLVNQERWQDALDVLLPLTKNPDQFLAAHALYFAGVAYSGQGRLDDALTEFQRVRSNYPNTDLSLYAGYRIYESYKKKGMTEQARVAAAQFAQTVRESRAIERFRGLGEYVGGVEKFEHKDYAAALRDFQLIYEHYEDSPFQEAAAAMVLLCNNQLGRYDAAVALGAKYLQDHPEIPAGSNPDWRARIIYNLADAYYYSPDMKNAEDNYLKVKNEFPYAEVRPLAITSLGWIYLQQKNDPGALVEFRQNMESRNIPALVLSLYGTGIAQYNIGRYDSALSYFAFDKETYEKQGLYCDVAAALVPDNFYYTGQTYYRLGYYANALDAWQRLITEYPASPRSIDGALKLGELYFQGAKYDDAINSFSWLIQHAPTAPQAQRAQLMIAQSYYNKNDLERAMKEYEATRQLSSSDSLTQQADQGIELVYFRKAQMAPTVQEMEQSVADMRAAAPRSKLLKELYYNLGERYFKSDLPDSIKYNRAVAAYREVVAVEDTGTTGADARLGIAESFFRLKQWGEAAAEYARFYDQFPNHVAAPGALYYQAVCYYNLGVAYQNDQNPIYREYVKRALELFRQVIERYPKSEFIENSRKNIKASEDLLK